MEPVTPSTPPTQRIPSYDDVDDNCEVIDLCNDEDEENFDDEQLDDEPEYGAFEDHEDRRVQLNKRSRPAFQEWRTTHVPVEKPDLHQYFARFVMDDQSQIALCRSYASYLAAKNRPAGGTRGPYKKAKTLGTKVNPE